MVKWHWFPKSVIWKKEGSYQNNKKEIRHHVFGEARKQGSATINIKFQGNRILIETQSSINISPQHIVQMDGQGQENSQMKFRVKKPKKSQQNKLSLE